jgi:hypothetical protein
VLSAVDKFYSEIVQHIKPWTPAPPKIRETDAETPDEPIAEDDILAGGGQHREDASEQMAARELTGT